MLVDFLSEKNGSQNGMTSFKITKEKTTYQPGILSPVEISFKIEGFHITLVSRIQLAQSVGQGQGFG